MATRTWLSVGSTDMNLATNYSGTGVLLVTDDLVFDATSVINATATAVLSVGTITANTGYTGIFDQNQQAITCAGVVYFNSTGNVIVNGGLLTVGGNFEITTSTSTLNMHGLELVFTASGQIKISKGGAPTNAVRSILVKSGVQIFSTAGLYIRNDNGTVITLEDATASFAMMSHLTDYSSGVCKPIEDNNGDFYATTGYTLSFKPLDTGIDTEITLPRIIGGNPLINIKPTNQHTIDLIMSANITAKTINISTDTGNVVNLISFFAGIHNIDLTQAFTLDNKYVDTQSTINLDLGSGTHSMTKLLFEANVNSFTNVNFQSCNLHMSSSFDLSPIVGNRNINFGTSAITFDGIGAQTLNLDGETAYDVILDNYGGGLTLQNALSCNTFNVVQGDFNQAGFTVTTVGDSTFSDGILILDGENIITGDGDLTLNSTITSLDSSLGTYIFYGDCIMQHNFALNQDFNIIKGGADGKTFTYNSTLTSTTGKVKQLEILHANGSVVLNKKIEVYGLIPFVNNNGSLSTSWSIPLVPDSVGTLTLNLPTNHSNVSLYIQQIHSGLVTIEQQDNFDGSLFSVVTAGASSDWLFNTNNNDITTINNIIFQSANTSADGILNAGTSIFTAGSSILLKSTQPGSIFNLGSSVWSFGTTFTVDFSAGTFNADTSTIIANGTGVQSITTNGDDLYDVEVNNNGGGLTLVENLVCNTLDVIQGDFSQAGFNLTTVSDSYFRDGLLTLDGLYTMTGVGTFAIEDTVSNISAITSTLVFEETTSLFLKTNTSIGTIKGGSNTKTVTKQEYNTIYLRQFEFLGTGTINWQGTLILRGLIPFINTIGQFNNVNYNTIITAFESGDVTLNSNNNVDTLLEVTSSYDATINQTGPFDLRRFKLRTSAVRDIIYNTNDNAITINKVNSDFFVDNQITGSTLVFNAGSSIITTDIFAMEASVHVTMNMSTSVSNIGTDLRIDADTFLTYNYGSSILNFNGTADQTITALGTTLGVLKVDKPSGKINVIGNSHWSRYLFLPSTVIEFDHLGTHTLATCIEGDLVGEVGNLITISSDLPGTPYDFINDTCLSVSYIAVQDSNATNPINASDGTNVDNTGNTNWFFSTNPFAPITSQNTMNIGIGINI